MLQQEPETKTTMEEKPGWAQQRLRAAPPAAPDSPTTPTASPAKQEEQKPAWQQHQLKATQQTQQQQPKASEPSEQKPAWMTQRQAKQTVHNSLLDICLICKGCERRETRTCKTDRGSETSMDECKVTES